MQERTSLEDSLQGIGKVERELEDNVGMIELKLGGIRDRIAANHKAEFTWDEELVEAVLARCTEVDSGARNVDHILNGSLLPEIAEVVLGRMAEGAGVERIKLSAGKNGEFKYAIK